ncbi:hypothetical protein AB0892_32080, partial [Streptomyces sp. NPDC005409]|uniref:hypothetical protein n=1 Tax=Streptomyces sp. NPDC005409 TaxID=3155342 RepID=UPI003451AEA8
MARTPSDLDELVEHWTLLKDEQVLVSGKRGATRLGFAVLLKLLESHPQKGTGVLRGGPARVPRPQCGRGRPEVIP